MSFGGSKSKSKTTTTNTWYDQRQVNDAAGGVVGTGNTQDQSIRLNDSSRSSTSTTINALDGGAIKAAQAAQTAAIASADKVSAGAFGLANAATKGAYASSADALDFGRDTLERVVGLASKAIDQAGNQAEAAGEIAGNAYAKAADIASGAYSGAADSASGNRTLMYVAVGAVALVGAVVAFGLLKK